MYTLSPQKKEDGKACFHSYLNASTGFNLDAWYAGTTPEIIPMPTEPASAISIVFRLITSPPAPNLRKPGPLPVLEAPSMAGR